MAASSDLLVKDSSVKSLIGQRQSSSSPRSSVESPNTDSSVPISSRERAIHVSNHQTNLTVPLTSSSSFSSVSEIVPVIENEVRRHRWKKNKSSANKEHSRVENTATARFERTKQEKQPRAFVDYNKKAKGCHGNVCCRCIGGFTADCAAVCCCPLALLHLAALTFIRLPTAVAWKVVVKLKNRVFTKRNVPKDPGDISGRSKSSYPWSDGNSPEGSMSSHMQEQMAKFDLERQNLWKHIEAGRLEFGGGGLSLRTDSM
ncbi:hypothetical protein KP509_1Z032400 [Ceratopteris richardii]|nr:hypothetical protein KP509_1Z032400 [Ceratopteris richardii]KAH6559011.1 hypothetical protein KP509_1Z032400 [Ceratopteris richardii]KAH6559012.1 hypothetical protein KP509_1Z032400 [Ceratopteris richardii]